MRRFSLKFLFLLTFVIAIVFLTTLAIQQGIKDAEIALAIEAWSRSIAKSNQAESLSLQVGTNIDGSPKMFQVCTGDMIKISLPNGVSSWASAGLRNPQSQSFFVIPPGKYVNGIQEVIAAGRIASRD